MKSNRLVYSKRRELWATLSSGDELALFIDDGCMRLQVHEGTSRPRSIHLGREVCGEIADLLQHYADTGELLPPPSPSIQERVEALIAEVEIEGDPCENKLGGALASLVAAFRYQHFAKWNLACAAKRLRAMGADNTINYDDLDCGTVERNILDAIRYLSKPLTPADVHIAHGLACRALAKLIMEEEA